MPKLKPKDIDEAQPAEKKTIDRPIRLGSELETDYKSSYYPPSYDFPYNPDRLVGCNNYSTYDEMRDDSQIKATLAIKKNMIIGSGWQICVAEEVPESTAEEIKNQLTDMFENISVTQTLNNTFEDILMEVMTHYDYGFSLSEVIYKYEDGIYKINKFVTRPPHTFEFHIDDKGTIKFIRQNMSRGYKNFDPSIFFHSVYQPEYGNPYGKSDLKSAHEAWKAKKYIARFMNIFLEKYAAGFTVVKYPEDAHDDIVSRLEEAAKAIKFNSSIVIPDNVMIEIIQASTSTADIFIKALEYYNLQISRSILVPDLMGFGGGQTSGGSYALGKQQFNIFLGSIFSDKQALARKLTTKIIMPLVRANFGDFPVWFEFIPPTSEDIIQYASTWQTAVGSRLWKPNEEEINHFRNILGFPEGKIDEVENQINPLQGGLPADKNKNKDDMNKKDEQRKKKDEMAKKKEFKARRQLTRYEKKVDFEEIEKTFDRFDSVATREIKASAKDVINSLIEQIRMNPKAISTLEPKFLKPMNATVKRNFIDIIKKSLLFAKNEIMSKQFTEEDDEIEFYQDIVENEAFKTVGDYSSQMSKKATNMIATGMKNNLPYSEIVKIMKAELEGESEKWINTVVRTKTNEIFNETRKRYFETNEVAKNIVVAYQWSAILDERTSDICEELDGTIFDIDDSQILKPPAHPNCRSLLVPITKFEDYKDDENYLTGKDMYTIDEIHEMGGNLIQGNLKDNNKYVRVFVDSLMVTGNIKGMHNFKLIPQVFNKQIKVLSVLIANMSYIDTTKMAFYEKDEYNVAYENVIKPNDIYMEKYDNFVLDVNDSLWIRLSLPCDIAYTIEYILV
jgi:SPP1 gp7 family putative phage head morphogenesis protein